MTEKFIVETAKDGNKTIKINIDGKYNYIHSKYSPINEAQSMVKKLGEVEPGGLIICFGMGFLYHINSLPEEYFSLNKILIIEPSRELFDIIEKNVDITRLKQNENVAILVEPDQKSLKLYLMAYAQLRIVNRIKVMSLPVYMKAYLDCYKCFAEQYKMAVKENTANEMTQINLAYPITENTFKNMKYMLDGYHVGGFKDSYINKPVIVVSSGPSLEKNIDLLKQLQGKVLIVAVFSVIKKLSKHNIVPDMIVAVDPKQGRWIPRIKERLEEDAWKARLEGINFDIPLLGVAGMSSALLGEYRKERLFTEIDSQKAYVDLIRPENAQITNFKNIGGSVATLALAFAQYIGANPVVFVGQDLAYTDEKFHVSDTAHHQKVKELETIRMNYMSMYVKDINGNQIKTSIILNVYRQVIERFIEANNETTYIDATEGGAYIEGTEVKTLAEIVETYRDLDFNTSEYLNEYFSKSKFFTTNEDKLEFLNILRQKRDYIYKLEEESKKALELSKQFHEELSFAVDNYQKIERYYARKLDPIREMSEQDEFVTVLFDELAALWSNKSLDILDNHVDKYAIANVNILYFEQWLKMIEYVLPLFNSAINDVETQIKI